MAGGGEIEIDAASTTTYAGIISGSGTFSKGLAGTLELSGANSYTGLTTVSDGTLRLTGGAAISDTGAVNLSTSGAVVRVPLFVGQDEIIKVNTRTGEYESRVK